MALKYFLGSNSQSRRHFMENTPFSIRVRSKKTRKWPYGFIKMIVRWLWTSLPSPTTSSTRQYWSRNTFLRTDAWERRLLQKKSHLSVIAERNQYEFFWFTSTLVITWTSCRIIHFLNDPKLKGLDSLQVLLAFCWCQDSLGTQSLVTSQCWLILYL